MKKILVFCLGLVCFKSVAQDSTATLTISGYAEIFYAYETNRPENNRRPSFLYSHNRQNEFNANLAFLKAAYSAQKVRANIAIGTGTYMADNYANEPVVLRNIVEANVGFRLHPKLWLDAGVLPSHIGFESAVSKDCWALTRGLLAENSPYFETGAKLTFTPDDRWTLALLALNGWQRISRINTTPALGSQVAWKHPNGKVTLNWSTFYGSDRADSIRQMRFFNNFYGIFQMTEKFGLTAGFDIGMEQTAKGSSAQNTWFTPIVVARYQINDRWAVAGRAEHYNDQDGVIIAPDFSANGFSLNVDYAPVTNALLRLEGRLLNSLNEVFLRRNGTSNNNFYLTASLALSF